MQDDNISLLLKSPTLTKTVSVLIFVISPLLFFSIIAHFSELSFSADLSLFVLMIVGFFLGMHLYTIGDLAESFLSVLQIKKLSYKKFQFLQSKIIFEYAAKQFELLSFSNISLNGIIRGLYYTWGTWDFGIPKSHLDLWINIKDAGISCIEDPYREILRKYSGSLGEFMKPNRYIEEDLKEYGENISDLFFLGFTERGKNKYLLVMLDWNTKSYVLAKVLDVMSEIIEEYERD